MQCNQGSHYLYHSHIQLAVRQFHLLRNFNKNIQIDVYQIFAMIQKILFILYVSNLYPHSALLHSAEKRAHKPVLIFPCKLLELASGWLASWSSLMGKFGTSLSSLFLHNGIPLTMPLSNFCALNNIAQQKDIIYGLSKLKFWWNSLCTEKYYQSH